MNFILIKGHSIHYRYLINPSGVNFVLINSLGTDLRIWEDVAAELHRYGSVLCFDKPGHGLSSFSEEKLTIDDYGSIVIGLLDAFQMNQCVLIGVSIGGTIAQKVAVQYPDRISHLVLSNTAQKIGDAAFWNARIEMIREKGMDTVSGSISAKWMSASFLQHHKAAAWGLSRMLESTSAEGYITACEAIRDEDMINVGLINCPVLCIAGSEDISTPPSMVQALAAAISNAKFSIVPGAGHLPCVEFPQTVAERIIELVVGSWAEESLFVRGMQTRRAVLGNTHVDNAAANTTTLDADFQQYITEQAWGAIWSRPHLTKRERSMLTIALLTALGYEAELAMHIRASANTGTSEEDVKEVLLHTSVYAGVPPVNGAFKIAKEVYGSLKHDHDE